MAQPITWTDRNAPQWASNGSRGAASELRACAHLLAQGWDVYRSESPAAPFDLVAHRAGVMLRIEVKSTTWTRGSVTFCWPKNEDWDLLIVVDDSGVCSEIRTHDRDAARDQVCAHHGLPSPRRLPGRNARLGCQQPGCDEPHEAKGLCVLHYGRTLRPPLTPRLP